MIHSGGSGEVEARWEQRVHRGAERPSAVMTVVHGRTKSTSDYKQRVACLSKSFPPLCNCSHGLSYTLVVNFIMMIIDVFAVQRERRRCYHAYYVVVALAYTAVRTHGRTMLTVFA